MRDVGILVWVGLLIVGVVGSMVSSLRRQAQVRPMPAKLPEWARQIGATVPQAVPPPAPPAAPGPRAAPARAPSPKRTPPPPSVQEPAHHLLEEPHKRAPRLFGSRRELVRAVIAAEVLGKPRAFSDEYFGR